MESAEYVRPSRDGDQFHYVWASRRSLRMLDPLGRMVMVAVEGRLSMSSALNFNAAPPRSHQRFSLVDPIHSRIPFHVAQAGVGILHSRETAMAQHGVLGAPIADPAAKSTALQAI
jgi:hypothetical protein